MYTLPTSTAERSFYTLKRGKKHLRNIMKENRINGIASFNIHIEVKVSPDHVKKVLLNRGPKNIRFCFVKENDNNSSFLQYYFTLLLPYVLLIRSLESKILYFIIAILKIKYNHWKVNILLEPSEKKLRVDCRAIKQHKNLHFKVLMFKSFQDP